MGWYHADCRSGWRRRLLESVWVNGLLPACNLWEAGEGEGREKSDFNGISIVCLMLLCDGSLQLAKVCMDQYISLWRHAHQITG